MKRQGQDAAREQGQRHGSSPFYPSPANIQLVCVFWCHGNRPLLVKVKFNLRTLWGAKLGRVLEDTRPSALSSPGDTAQLSQALGRGEMPFCSNSLHIQPNWFTWLALLTVYFWNALLCLSKSSHVHLEAFHDFPSPRAPFFL